MCRTMYIFLILAFLPTIVFSGNGPSTGKEKNNLELSALTNYIEILTLTNFHDETAANVVANDLPMDIVKKHIVDAGFNWEYIAQLLYPHAKEAVAMLEQSKKNEVPEAVDAVKDLLRKDYLFDQFEDLEQLKNLHQVSRLYELLEKVDKGTLVILLLDGLIFDAENEAFSLVALDAKEVIDAMLEKGVVVLGYANMGFSNVSRVISFLESNDIRFSKVAKIRSIALDDNQGLQDGVLAGRSLSEVVNVFQVVDDNINLVKGEHEKIIFVTDKDVIAEKIREDAKKIKASIRVFQCTFIAQKNEIEEIAND